MSLIGYTSGGSPIFSNGLGGSGRTKPAKKTNGQKNTRYKCSDPSCTAVTTKNQRKKNGSRCFSCKTPFTFAMRGYE